LRFQSTNAKAPVTSATTQQSDEYGIGWDDLVIQGTSQALEKQYLRLTSAPDPSTVRPESVLKEALKTLKKKWKENTAEYAYICEQLKSIRQDFTIQHIKK